MTGWDDLYKDEDIRKREGSKPPADFVLQWADRSFNFKKRPHILDVGCGTGRNAFGLIDKGAIVHGCDYALSIIEHLRTSEAGKRLASLEVCEADALPYPDESFDGVLCDQVLFYLPPERMRAVFWQMFRALKPRGGLLVRTAGVDDKRNVGIASTDHGLPMYFLTGQEIMGMAEGAGFMVAWLLRNEVVPHRHTRQQDWILLAMKPAS